MPKSIIKKCKRELKCYTFPEKKYEDLIDQSFDKKEIINEAINRRALMRVKDILCQSNGNIIYYDSLKKINNNINEWIKIFTDKVRNSSNKDFIYDCYEEILDNIRNEINLYICECENKYGIKYVISDTLIISYTDILLKRKHKIDNDLCSILQNEFGIYYSEYSDDLICLYNFFSYKILCNENNEDIYEEFRSEVRYMLNNTKRLVKAIEIKEVY